MRSLTWIILLCANGQALTARDPLVTALQDRLTTAKAVAMAKHNSGAPVEDRPRERTVIHGAVRLAVKMGVDVELTVKVFSAQIEASKMAQRAFLESWKGKPAFERVPDLTKEVRPKLDALTPIILRELKKGRCLPKSALSLGPSEPLYREAWMVAIQPLLSSIKR